VRYTGARVGRLYRYPVKSMVGEEQTALTVDERGVTGDRLWSVRTVENKIGSGKASRRFAAIPRLLTLRARTADAGVLIDLPTGEELAPDDPAVTEALSAYLGQPVTMARETDVSHFDDGPLSLIGSASVAALSNEIGADVDMRRFRANIIVDGLPPFAEDNLVGRRINIGEVALDVLVRSPRCVMIDMETADLPAQPGNLRGVGRVREACLGVIARVVAPGQINVGDELVVPPRVR